MLKNILLIAAGGALGSVLRYLSFVFVNRFFTTVFPVATFAVNIIGCLLIGVFIGTLQKHHPEDGLKWFLITGFCGGFTTFSAFSAENYDLITSQNSAVAFVYIAASVLGGLLAVWGGLALSQ